ncbi:DNA recombination protein RmuC [Salinimonas sp. HHU 13199]|uniref:DNA recombination protein RmuC n=1 Tax=Salinimonas profundi TaxID=2729140 RepID=A0ABR8LKB8_9ALTE|nr:DNA recombination protein RmuC [Salinimonas profundi]MBD3584509.1 DNA recombination protein RmuC [Salinimonas profundi]
MNTEALTLIGSGALAGLVSGALVTYWLCQRRFSLERNSLTEQNHLLQQQTEQAELYFNRQLSAKQDELAVSQERLFDAQNQIGELGQKAAQLARLESDYAAQRQELKDLQQAHSQLNARHEAQSASFKQSAQSNDEKIAMLEAAEQRLQTQFENLANKIFTEKSESFTQTNKSGMDALINPLKEQLESFKRQISDQYNREGQERASLKTEILSLKELNQRITEEASALTMALKGDNKKQGNWGEVVLERILKESGLREGHEFETQVSLRSDHGRLQQPDVVVHLPNDKDVIIDSKVSLAAYERYFNAEDEVQRSQLLKEHVSSVKGHIKGLGAKDYQELAGLKTLDYVLMFIPVEPAFLLAIEEEPDLVTLALNHNIMLVSPTNLLVALRTINNIWQYEYQNQNAQKIAAQAGRLYDKFTGFVADMDKIGKSLEATQKHFDGALGKLSTGRGNLVRQVEQFRGLGVQPSKRLSDEMIRGAMDSDDDSLEEDAARSSLP